MDPFLAIALVPGLALLCVYALWYQLCRVPYTTIPGPKPHWFYGNIREFPNPYKFHRDLERLCDQYGPITRMGFFGRLLVLISEPAEFKNILSRPFDEVGISPRFSRAFGQISEGLLPLNGDTWRRHRKLLQPAFGLSNLRLTVRASNTLSDDLIEQWEETARTGEFRNVMKDFNALTVDVIGLVGFGYQFNTLKTGDSVAHDLTQCLTRGVPLRVRRPPWTWFMLPDAKEFDKARHELRRLCADVLATRKAGRRVRITDDENEPRDLMDLMLDTQDTPGGLNDKEILDETIMFFAAGHETTANTLGWLAYLVGKYPEVQRKLQAEVDTVLGERIPDWDDLTKLQYTEMVIKETLRLYPVASHTARFTLKPIESLGHVIPANTLVVTNWRHAQRNPKYWGDSALEFIPERWTDFRPVPGTYLPFGDGPKMCIGQRLAMIELKTILARIMQRFTISLKPGFEPDDVSAITVGPKNGVLVGFERR